MQLRASINDIFELQSIGMKNGGEAGGIGEVWGTYNQEKAELDAKRLEEFNNIPKDQPRKTTIIDRTISKLITTEEVKDEEEMLIDTKEKSAPQKEV